MTTPPGKRRAIGALVPYAGDASVRLEGVELAWTLPVIALSHEALLVRSPESAPAGSLVHLELTTGSDLVQGMGEVAGVRPVGDARERAHEILIQLLFVDEPSRSVLRRLVSESGGEGAAVEWAAEEAAASAIARSAPVSGRAAPASAPEAAGGSEPEAEPARADPLLPAGPISPSPRTVAVPPPGSTALQDASPARLPGEAPSSGEQASERAAEARSPQPPRRPPEPATPKPPPAAISSGGWTLDPVDATEVAAVDLEPSPAPRVEPAAESSTREAVSGGSAARGSAAGELTPRPGGGEQALTGRDDAGGSTATRRVAGGAAAASVSGAGPPRRMREGDALAAALRSRPAGAPPADPAGCIEGPAGRVEDAGGVFGHDRAFDDVDHALAGEAAPPAPRSRGWLLPALLLILALAAAWWTRDAWLGRSVAAPEAGPSTSGSGERQTASDSEPAATSAVPPEPDAAGPDPAAPAGSQGSTAAGEGAEGEGAESSSSPIGLVPGAPTVAAERSDGPLELVDVEVEQGRGETRVRVTLSGPIEAARVSSFALPTPPRFVVRLPGVAGAGLFSGGTPELAQVRVGLHEGRNGEPETHVVFDLAALGTTGSISVAGPTIEVRLVTGG